MPDFSRAVRERLRDERLSAVREAEIVEELTQHMDDRYADLLRRGATPSAAEATVRDELMAETTGARWGRGRPDLPDAEPTVGGGGDAGLLRGVRGDFAFALRTLRRNPVFTGAALTALGLGIGAATAVFSLLDGVVLRPLAYEAPEQLVMLTDTRTVDGLRDEPVSPVTFLDHRASGAFTDAAAWWVPQANLVDDAGDPIRVNMVETSENLFDVLGVTPQRGRAFERDSTLHGSESHVLISDRLWRSRFGGRDDVLGSTVRLNGFPHEVIGVMPPDFNFPDDTDVWQRLAWDLAQHSRHARFMGAVARLEDGITVAGANTVLAEVSRRIADEHPASNRDWGTEAVALSADVAGVFGPALYALFAAAGLLLLIGCINVANLLLARAAAREAELAVRGALGATRRRLVRQLLVESMLLAGLGALIGFGVATVAVNGFLAWSPIEVPRAAGIGVDLRVLAFAMFACFTTALVFGFVPAIRASKADLLSVLRRATRTGSSAGGNRSRTALLVIEVALSVALLCCAGLLIRTMTTLARQDTGVVHTDAVVADVQLPDAEYDFPRATAFFTAVLDDIRATGRVSAAGAANFLPLEAGWRMQFERADMPSAPDAIEMVQHHSVEHGWFETVGARILSGRGFDARDDARRAGTLIINETLARQYFGDTDPIGRRLRFTGRAVGPMGFRTVDGDEHEIVGVVSDIRNISLSEPAEAALYWPASQFPFRKMYIVARGSASQSELAAIIRDAVRRQDANLPISGVRTMERVLTTPADPTRLVMLVMTVFAVLALVLAVTGIYGVLSYMIDQRRREIGVRLALGATPGSVQRMIVRSAVVMGVLGTAAGLLLALLIARAIERMLFGVTIADPIAMGTAAVVALTAVLIAAAAPARRAALTDPMRTLRE